MAKEVMRLLARFESAERENQRVEAMLDERLVLLERLEERVERTVAYAHAANTRTSKTLEWLDFNSAELALEEIRLGAVQVTITANIKKTPLNFLMRPS
jgi:hypothetical protein